MEDNAVKFAGKDPVPIQDLAHKWNAGEKAGAHGPPADSDGEDKARLVDTVRSAALSADAQESSTADALSAGTQESSTADAHSI